MAKRTRVSTSGRVTHDVNSSTTVNADAQTMSVGANYHPHSGGDVQYSVGVQAGANGVGVTPTVQIGEGEGNRTGAKVGATAGSAIGGALGGAPGAAIGSAIGSAAGSVIGGTFNPSAKSGETDKRRNVITAYGQQLGLWGEDGKLQMADGSTWTMDDSDRDSGSHSYKDSGKVVKGDPERNLFNYEIDYTNDLDYASGVAGISLSRLLGGGTSKHIDQVGNSFGNAFLGKSGYGASFTKENFDNTMTNARATYAKAGIKSKSDMLALANKAHAEGRLNDADYVATQQAANFVFDNDFGAAQQLMGGRWKGVQTAQSTPSHGASEDSVSGNRAGRITSPVISPEEAYLSVSPFFDEYRKRHPIKGPSKSMQTAQTLSSYAGAISALAGAYTGVNRASGGALGDYISSGIRGIGEYLGMEGADSINQSSESVGTVNSEIFNNGETQQASYDGMDFSLTNESNADPSNYQLDTQYDDYSASQNYSDIF